MRLRRKPMMGFFLFCLASLAYLALHPPAPFVPPPCEGCWHGRLPAYPGAENVNFAAVFGTLGWDNVEFETDAMPRKVFEFYQRTMPEQGWTADQVDERSMWFSKGGDSLILELVRHSNGKTHAHFYSYGGK